MKLNLKPIKFENSPKKIACLVSGGVDSSVALALLKEQGHDVDAYYLKIWLEDDLSSLGECPWEDDLSFVREVCDKLNVPIKIINLQKEYWDRVVAYCIEQVRLGNTPNPDMLCNSRVKFAAFFDAVDITKYDFVASGHYADTKVIRNEKTNKQFTYLARVRDQIKDQSYFLANLSQAQVQKIVFPLAPYLKSEVRELAHKFDLPNKNRKDSQGICFLGKIKYNDFLKHYLKEQNGDIIEIETGKILGKHKGFWYHTIGQRKGTGLGGGPWIVVKKDCAKNIIYVSNKEVAQHAKNTFLIRNVNWIATPPPHNCKVKLRHGPKLHNCSITKVENEVDCYKVTLAHPDAGIASGQYAVFYDDTLCFGCGVIVDE
jgi:tRNA (5-methylaminomethyl-2-thiouridylate)-methyltransferase